MSVARYPTWVIVISTFLQTSYRNFGLLLCYIAMVLVATLSDLSLITLIYLTIVFVCWLIHYLSGNPYHHIRRLWLSFVIFDGIVLIAKYMYQFKPVYEYLEKKYTIANGIH